MVPGLLGVVPRKPRGDAEPGTFHVFARGYGKMAIFRDRRDRKTYLDLVGEAVAKFHWRCLAFCLMENHVHLLVQVENGSLGSGMQSIHGRYGQRFNRRHGRVGHLFQGRFGSVRINSDQQMWAVIAYIARNPVEAGLCPDPVDWEWSSHSAVLDLDGPTWLDVDGLLSWFESDGGDPLARYRDLTGSDPLSIPAQGV